MLEKVKTTSGLTIGSLFSGCGGFDLGFHRAGFRTLWGCEIEAKPAAVFRRHFPDAQLLGDINEIDGSRLEPVDGVIFGSPCQDLSVAGRREGLKGAQSGLFHEAMRVIDELPRKPRFCVWENVPGALSSNRGADFQTVLEEVGKRWRGVAYRVLDLQFFGPPQRRKRVFVVGHSGGWRRAAEVLFEPEGMRWDSPPRREEGQEATGTLTRSLGAGGTDDNREQAGFYGPTHEVAPCIQERGGKGVDSDCTQALCVHATQDTITSASHDASEDGTGRGTPLAPFTFEPRCARNGRGMPSETVNALKAQAGRTGKGDAAPCVATSQQSSMKGKGTIGYDADAQTAKPCKTQMDGQMLHLGMQVRRLTPRECERLMGWPDDYTAWGVDDKSNHVEMSDSARYRMIGNGVGSPVAEWLARRVHAVDLWERFMEDW